jgi:hypothetical protein
VPGTFNRITPGYGSGFLLASIPAQRLLRVYPDDLVPAVV